MTGLRPVVDIMFGDFLTLIMDQMVNQAAKVHYMSGGKWKVPMVLRTTMGASRRSAAQHSQSLHAWLSHIPGPEGGAALDAVRRQGADEDRPFATTIPVVIFEDKMMFRVKGPVPAEEYTIPFGVADIKRAGDDITIVATSSMVQVALGAAKMLEEIGISAEVVDPRTTWPLDEKTLDRVGEEDFAGDRHRRRLRSLRRDGRDRLGDRRRRVLQSGRAGEAHRRDARADSVLAAARGRDGADRASGVRSGAGAVQAVVVICSTGLQRCRFSIVQTKFATVQKQAEPCYWGCTWH